MTRQAIAILVLVFTAALAVSACSQATKYRVLTFFLDGVPEPGAVARDGEGIEKDLSTPSADDGRARRVSTKPPQYVHPPYRENRCKACHDPETRQLFSTPQEGLCRRCHTGLPGNVVYVHGPVAVSDCLFCHHHHASTHKNVLLDEPRALCFRCHKRQDLTVGLHHETIDQQLCTECHNPHGADNRFFLKRAER